MLVHSSYSRVLRLSGAHNLQKLILSTRGWAFFRNAASEDFPLTEAGGKVRMPCVRRQEDEHLPTVPGSMSPLSSSPGFHKDTLYIPHTKMFTLGIYGVKDARDSEKKLSFHGISNKLNLIQTLFNEHLFYTNKLTGVYSSLIKPKRKHLF